MGAGRRLLWFLTAAATIRSQYGFQLQSPLQQQSTIKLSRQFSRYAAGTVNGEEINGKSTSASGIQELTNLSNIQSSNIKIRPTVYDLLQAACIGIGTGYSVAAFKLAIKKVQTICYSLPPQQTFPSLLAICPAIGGLLVGLLTSFGPFREGLKGTVIEVDQASMDPNKYSKRIQNHLGYLRKVFGSVITLGTGCSLGPEGPCVEIGMGVARNCMDLNRKQPTDTERKDWNRLLLSCGAAAGVAAGFNAPIAGVFFAMEVMQDFFSSSDNQTARRRNFVPSDVLCSTTGTAKIAPVLLSSVLAALCARTLLGSHLALKVGSAYSLNRPLLELPIYVLLGVCAASVSFVFNSMMKCSRSFYDGGLGTPAVRNFMKRLPLPIKPLSAGLLCGIVSLWFPQILFFGYETLNPLLGNSMLPTGHLMSLLVVKMAVTAVCAGSGLVGGTFAPSLFLGAVTGASLHNVLSSVLGVTTAAASPMADLPAYAIVGAGSVLAALFRAPLTACLMLFEVTRDYDVILPLMASAGVSGVLVDIFQGKAARFQKRRRTQESNQQQAKQ